MKYSFIILLLIFSIPGCDLFNTREAELPVQPRDNFQLAVTPELLIENLINSYKDKNLQNYISSFSDSSFSSKIFIYYPSSDASNYPFLADGWGKRDEEQFFNNLKSKVPKNLPITVNFSNINSLQQGDSIAYSAGYSISIPFEDNSIPGYYQGELKFILSRDSRLIWVITSWYDNKNSQNPSWSELKGRLY